MPLTGLMLNRSLIDICQNDNTNWVCIFYSLMIIVVSFIFIFKVSRSLRRDKQVKLDFTEKEYKKGSPHLYK